MPHTWRSVVTLSVGSKRCVSIWQSILDCLGRCLVSQGSLLFYLERYSDATRALESGSELLDHSSYRDRFTLFQLLALIAQTQGKFSEALEHCSQARPFATNDYQRGKICWTEACIFGQVTQWDAASEAFALAFQNLCDAAPIDAALSTCDHVKLLIACGRLSEARQQIARMRRLMEPLTGNLIASAAIRDLIRSEQEGNRLSLALIQRISKRVEESRRVDTRRQ